MLIMVILQAEQRAGAGSASAELPQGPRVFAQGKKKLHGRIFSYTS